MSRSIDTLCIHAGQEPDPVSGAVMTPIVLATTFAQDGPGAHKGYDDRRNLWPELFRCVRETRPRAIVAENVSTAPPR